MRICLLAPANNPHTIKIAYTLIDKGYEVFICTFHNARLDGIVVKYFPFRFGLLGKVNYLLNYPLIKTYLKEIKPDVLHAHYVSSYGVVGMLTKYHPFIISVWGMDIYEATMNLFLRYMIKKSLKNADYILSTSDTMAKRVKYFVEKNIIVTPFGVDLSKFYLRPKKIKGKFIIGTARRLMAKYGVDYLIKAFSVFANSAPDAELHIAGDGPQKNELVALVEKLKITPKVKFYGFVAPQLIPEFLSNLDIFVMPSISESESFGVAALEAQACGVPVIASKIGGLHETIIDSETGYLVPPKDINALVQKMQFLYKNREQLAIMGRLGVEFVKKKYNWKENIILIEKIYEKFK